MVDWTKIGAGVAGAAASVVGGNRASRSQSRNIGQSLDWYRGLLRELQPVSQQALQQRKAGLADIKGGYDRALALTRGAGRSAEISARDTSQQALDADVSDLISRGVYSTSMLSGARRGHSYELSRAIGEITERTALGLGALETQRGHALAGARGDIASQLFQNFGARASIRQGMIDTLLSMTPYSQDYGFDIGTLFGSLFGGDEEDAGPAYRAGGGQVQ